MSPPIIGWGWLRTAIAEAPSGTAHSASTETPSVVVSSAEPTFMAPTIPAVSLAAMDLRIFTEPQEGATYDDLLAVALQGRIARVRRLLPFRPLPRITTRVGLPGPDRRVDHAGRAGPRHVDDPARHARHLGDVPPSRARWPSRWRGVDQMSGGRVELGLGAGWYDDEHHAHGIPYPGLGERFERLEEQLEIVTGMWETPAGETFSHDGTHYSLVDSPAPAQARAGRTCRSSSAATVPDGPRAWPPRFADEFNVAFSSLADTIAINRTVTEACEQRGRDAAAAGCARPPRPSASVRRTTSSPAAPRRSAGEPDEIRGLSAAAGTVDEVVEKLSAFGDGGITRIYLQMLDLADLDHLDLVAASVAPAVSG